MRGLRHTAVIIALQSEIKQYLENNTEIQQGLVLSVSFISDRQLDIPVNSEDPQGFHDQVDQDQEENILYKKTAQEYRISGKPKIQYKETAPCMRGFFITQFLISSGPAARSRYLLSVSY